MYPEMRHALEKRGLLKAKVTGHKGTLTWQPDGIWAGHRHFPRDPGSLKLRMVMEPTVNTLRFGGDCTPQSSSDKVIGSVELNMICR